MLYWQYSCTNIQSFYRAGFLSQYENPKLAVRCFPVFVKEAIKSKGTKKKGKNGHFLIRMCVCKLRKKW